MNANELCPPPHLAASDIEGETLVTIKGVAFAEVGEERTKKGIVIFEEYTRGLIVNRTNLKRIAAIHGGQTDGWVGKTIKLFATETEFGGHTVPCIRVREGVSA